MHLYLTFGENFYIYISTEMYVVNKETHAVHLGSQTKVHWSR
jgi:hypothetical protein